jgi:hypothetical protein
MSCFPNSIPRCQHIKVNGTQCGSPALYRSRFCYFHKKWHAERVKINMGRARRAASAIDLPVLEDANSVQVALMQVMKLIISGRLDSKSAGLLLYALQTASLNLKHTMFEPYETKVIIDPRNVPDTPLGVDPWSEDDYEDIEYDEDEDDEDDDGEEDDEEEEDPPELTTEKEERFLEEALVNMFGPPEPIPKPAPRPGVADVDLARLDNEDKATWASMDAAARQRMVDEHKVPLKKDPPDPEKPWKNYFAAARKRAEAAQSLARKPVESAARPATVSSPQTALVPAGVGTPTGKNGSG